MTPSKLEHQKASMRAIGLKGPVERSIAPIDRPAIKVFLNFLVILGKSVPKVVRAIHSAMAV